jgi:hypothetical protein
MNFRSKDFAPVDVDSGNEAAISRQNASLPFHSPALLSSWNLTIRYQCASPPASRQREWSTSRKGSSGEEGRTRRSSGSGVEGWNSKSVSIEKKDVPTLPHNSRIRRYPPPRSHSIRHLTSRMFTTKMVQQIFVMLPAVSIRYKDLDLNQRFSLAPSLSQCIHAKPTVHAMPRNRIVVAQHI